MLDYVRLLKEVDSEITLLEQRVKGLEQMRKAALVALRGLKGTPTEDAPVAAEPKAEPQPVEVTQAPRFPLEREGRQEVKSAWDLLPENVKKQKLALLAKAREKLSAARRGK